MQLREAAERFAVQLRADGRSANTIAQYARHVALLIHWLEREGRDQGVAAITPDVLAEFLCSDDVTRTADGRPKKQASINAARTSVRILFAWIHDAGYARQNAARLVRRARCGKAPPRGLSIGDRERLLAALRAGEGRLARRDEVLFSLMLGAGLRIGEALALDVGDLDLEEGTVWIRTSKGDQPDRMPLGPELVELLRAFVGARRDGPLFLSAAGTRLCSRQASARFGGWLQAAGIERPASPHALRHTFAMGLYERTGDLGLVQAALRHRNVGATQIYARCSEARLRGVLGA